jgi:hypothetical protein
MHSRLYRRLPPELVNHQKFKIMSQTKRSLPLKVKMHSFLWSCLLLIVIITVSNGCTDDDKKTEGTKSEEKAPAPAGPNADFYQLRIDSATLVRTFFLSPEANRFKKLLLSYTVRDYREFPDSLTLWAQPAKQNDDLYTEDGCPAVLLQVKDTVKVPISKEVLFNTLELSFNKLKNLVGRDGQARRYKEVIFIPFAKDSCGKIYLNYRVRCWPPLGGADEGFEDANPCPPQKPNQN